MTEDAPLTGRCYCGALEYEATGAPLFKAQCHCRECQYISGGGPNYFMILPAGGWRWTQGSPQRFTRADLEHPVTRTFCGTCGTHVLTELPDGERVVLKVGTLDDPARYGGPRAAIYTVDLQPFHVIPDELPQFERVPQR